MGEGMFCSYMGAFQGAKVPLPLVWKLMFVAMITPMPASRSQSPIGTSHRGPCIATTFCEGNCCTQLLPDDIVMHLYI